MTEILDLLQFVRKHFFWPVVVGSAGFLLARNLIWLTARRPSRDHAYACLVAGSAGVALGWVIAGAWDDDLLAYWYAFTVGMALLAIILLFTVVVSFLGMWRKRP